jgi:hypothetical protein
MYPPHWAYRKIYGSFDRDEVSAMSKIKVTVYQRQADSEGYGHVAHAGSFCGFGNSHQEAIGNLLIRINRRVPEEFNFTFQDVEIQYRGHIGHWLFGRLM